MQNPTADFGLLKGRLKDAWMAGDFGVIARYAEAAEEEFVARLPLAPGTRMLDVACGTGNTAIPAAKAGAKVVGVDIATNLLEQARERARNAGVDIDFAKATLSNWTFRTRPSMW